MAVREHNMTQVAQSFTNTSLKFFTAGISLMWTPTLGQNLRIFKWIVRRVDQAACPRGTPA